MGSSSDDSCSDWPCPVGFVTISHPPDCVIIVGEGDSLGNSCTDDLCCEREIWLVMFWLCFLLHCYPRGAFVLGTNSKQRCHPWKALARTCFVSAKVFGQENERCRTGTNVRRSTSIQGCSIFSYSFRLNSLAYFFTRAALRQFHAWGS